MKVQSCVLSSDINRIAIAVKSTVVRIKSTAELSNQLLTGHQLLHTSVSSLLSAAINCDSDEGWFKIKRICSLLYFAILDIACMCVFVIVYVCVSVTFLKRTLKMSSSSIL